MVHQKNFPFHEPEDETEIIHVDPVSHSRAGWVARIVVILVICVVIFLSAKGLFDLGRGTYGTNDVPVIEANPEPYKTLPENPGGMEIPNSDKEIYGKIKMPIEGPIDNNVNEIAKDDRLEKLIESKNLDGAGKTTGPAPKEAAVVPDTKTIKFTTHGAEIVPSTDATEVVAQPHKAKRIDVEKVLARKTDTEIWLQLGSFKSEEEATKAWQDTREKNTDILKDMTIKVTKTDLKDQGVFYRLQAGSVEDEETAKGLCRKLNERKQSCFYTVIKNTPDDSQGNE